MARKRKSEEIIGKLREAEIVLAHRVWWSEDGSGPTDERVGEGERPFASGGIGPDAGQADPAGGFPGKLLSPARRLALYRSYPGHDAGVRTAGLPRARATSIDTAQDAARGR